MASSHHVSSAQHRRSRWHLGQLLAVGALASVALVGCGTSEGDRAGEATTSTTRPSAASTTAASGSAALHRQDLAQGETEAIASQLVDVPGYAYEDLSEGEIADGIAALQEATKAAGEEDLFEAISFHGVVADDESQNVSRTRDGSWEVGFLQLLDFTDPPPAGYEDEAARLGTAGLDEIDSFTVDGTQVAVFERPDSVDSRYALTWYRHGTQGGFDGAQLDPLETWVRAYLAIPEHEPDETDQLAAALVDVDGFAYANAWEPRMADLVEPIAGDDDWSAHLVLDETGPVGALVLIDQGSDRTPEELEAIARQLNPGRETLRMGFGGVVAVATETSSERLYTWSRDGILGIYSQPADENGLLFLMPYLMDL